MKKLHFSALADALLNSLRENMAESVKSDLQGASATITCDDGSDITAETDSDDNKLVYVCHKDAQREESCPNICDRILELIPNWGDIEDEVYEEDKDYVPGLDPGFGSWQDFYNYMYG